MLAKDEWILFAKRVHPLLYEAVMEAARRNSIIPKHARSRCMGQPPMCAGIFVTDHLRPAAMAAGIQIADGQRFGLHSLRSSMPTGMVSIEKTDVKTAQDMRHAGFEMLRSYAQLVTDEMHDVQVRRFESCGLRVAQNLLAGNAGSDAIQ
jgi:hypothetical protein